MSSHFCGGAALVLLFLLRHSVQSVDLLLAADRGLEPAAHIRRLRLKFGRRRSIALQERCAMPNAQSARQRQGPGEPAALRSSRPFFAKRSHTNEKTIFACSVITLIAMNFLENERK